MNFPKTLIIGGVKWKVIFDRKTKGGEFYWSKHLIKIDKSYSDERRFQVLIHEIIEAIMVNNMINKLPITHGEITDVTMDVVRSR